MSFTEILVLLMLLFFVFLCFLGIFKITINRIQKKAKTLTDAKLIAGYVNTRPKMQIMMGIAFTLLFSIAGPFIYFLYRKMHAVYLEEMRLRKLDIAS